MIKWALIALMIYNLVDLIATFFLLNLKEVVEVNPFMAAAYGESPLVFLLTKLALVSLGSILIYRLSSHPQVRPGFVRTLLFLTTFIYFVNVSYQLLFIVLTVTR
jgi:hypothetical protein